MSRRSQGDGSIFQLPDGSWRGIVDLGWHGGRRRRKYVRGRTKSEVVRETQRIAREAQAEQIKLERSPSVSD